MRRMSIIWLLPLIFTVCKSPYELVRTGPSHPALPKEAEVKVVSWSDINNYDQIAIVDVGEFTLDRRIKFAQDAARTAGGEFIAPRLSGDASKDNKTEYLVQSFAVLKKKAAPATADTMPKVSGGDDGKEIEAQEEPQGRSCRRWGEERLFLAPQGKLPYAAHRLREPQGGKIQGLPLPGKIFPHSPGA